MAQKKICAADNCGKPAWAKGYCCKHYQRLRHKGTVEDAAFKFRNRRMEYLNEVVVPYDGDDCLIWPYAKSPRPSCAVNGVIFNVCRYVCEKTHGAAPEANYHAAHSCGNGDAGCVTPRHLSWKTPKENAGDKYIHGSQTFGERHFATKYSDEDVQKIREIGRALPQRVIAEMFGMERSNVGRILRGDTRPVNLPTSAPVSPNER